MAKNVIERILEELEIQKNLVSNYDYISWLQKYTMVYDTFQSEYSVSNLNDTNDKNSKNIKNLYYFFKGITNYCHKIHFSVDYCDYYEIERVHIKHNNVGYQIGLVVGQGAYVYVTREEPKTDAIDFCHVVNDTKPEDFETKEKVLKKLELIICEAKDIGIPKNCITSIVEKILK